MSVFMLAQTHGLPAGWLSVGHVVALPGHSQQLLVRDHGEIS